MKLEAGKFYRTRDGRKVGPMSPHGLLVGDGRSIWYWSGRYYQGLVTQHDIVSEWVDDDHIERTKRMIEVMQAYVDGEKIEGPYGPIDYPNWDWWWCDYRIAEAKKPDSINWDHVAPEFICHARDEDGTVILYEEKPDRNEITWYSDLGKVCDATSHSSYQKGTVDWKDSLVMRLRL